MQPAWSSPKKYHTDDGFMQDFAPTLKYDTFLTLYGPEYIKRLSAETQEQFMTEIVASIFKDMKLINYAKDLHKFSFFLTDMRKIVRTQYAKTPIPELINPLAARGVLFLEPSELKVEDNQPYDDFKNRYGIEYFKDLPPHVRARFIKEIAGLLFTSPQCVERYERELRDTCIREDLKAELLAKCTEAPLLVVLQKASHLFRQHVFSPNDRIPSSGSFKECFERVITDYSTLDSCATTYNDNFFTSGFISEAHATKILAQHFKLNANSFVSELAEQKVDPKMPRSVREPLIQARGAVIKTRNSFSGNEKYQGLEDKIHRCEETVIANFVKQMDNALFLYERR